MLSFLCACASGYRAEKPVLVSSGGLKVNNLLYTPAEMKPGVKYPAVVLCHGGMSGVEFQTRGWARVLARAGYVVVLPQFRGQGGSEGHFEFAGGEVDDALAALKYLKGLGFVDADRIGMVGYSLGGLVTLRVLERGQGVKAAVLVSALSDPVGFFRDTWKNKLKDDGQFQKLLKEAELRSPLSGLEKINAPVLILHGDRDKRVDPVYSKKLYEALESADKDAELKIYPGMGHGIMWNYQPRADAVDFLDARLKKQ